MLAFGHCSRNLSSPHSRAPSSPTSSGLAVAQPSLMTAGVPQAAASWAAAGEASTVNASRASSSRFITDASLAPWFCPGGAGQEPADDIAAEDIEQDREVVERGAQISAA